MALVSESPYKTNYEIMALENDQLTHTHSERKSERLKEKGENVWWTGDRTTKQPQHKDTKVVNNM